jgi:hypothetical protein
MLESTVFNLDESIGEDDEAWDEDDTEDDEAFSERATTRFQRGVPRIGNPMQASRGVSSATLRTPAGNAELRLPQSVVTLEVFNKTVAGLREAHNKLAAEVSANRDAIKKSVADINSLAASTKKQFKRERKRVGQGNMMSMMIGMLLNKQTNTRIDSIQGAPAAGNDSTMLMLLPMMMMGDGGGSSSGDDNGMMMMVMMMAFMGN